MVPLGKALCMAWSTARKLRKGTRKALLAVGHVNLWLEMCTRNIFTVDRVNAIAPQFLRH